MENSLYALAVICWPFLAAVLRNVHALQAAPHLRLTRNGISLRYWPSVHWNNLRMLFPTYRIIEQEIPWSDYTGCTTFTHSLNEIPTYKALIIATTKEEHIIGWDVFGMSVTRLQSAILDFFEREFRQKAREDGRTRELTKQRFKTPLHIASDDATKFCLGLGAAAIVSCFVIMGFEPEFPDTGWTFIPLLLFAVSAYMLYDAWRERDQRHLELREEGFALGPRPDAMRLIPWDDILFVRANSKNVDHGLGESGARIESIDIRLRDRSSIVLYPSYKNRPLGEIQEFIDPPPRQSSSSLGANAERRRRRNRGSGSRSPQAISVGVNS